ncbi:VQ motif-containing protein 5 [Raphanus sativus]|uniref:VQ motif-containing protein 5 n=1 Tax=Raphanus sativus TaxID=3726 RepID=A0A6J0KM66_RAPSA|nr:VQ motif-containing protein 5 [Raphanus sativus]KAJ4881399.1 VQ motif-containing protein 5 [Raphanus sativus]
MNQRPRNDYLRVNRTGKYTRKSIFDQVHTNANVIPQQPRQPQPKTQVYIIDKEDFKTIVQQLTSNQSCEFLPQNLPNRQKIRPEATSPVPLNATGVHVSSHMQYFESLLEESSDSNGDNFQQSFDENQFHMQPMLYSNGDNFRPTFDENQSHMPPMSYSNGRKPIMTTTLPSHWSNGSPQQMDGAYSLQSTRVEYPQPLTPKFTFSSVTQPGYFHPDLGRF